IDDWETGTSDLAKLVQATGIRSSVGVPVIVGGELWGGLVAASDREEPMPPDTEKRLTRFTELVATAVANADARRELERVAAEQASLQRVATLVAEGRRPVEVFAAVTEQVAELFDAMTAVQRFDHDGPAVVFVGVSKDAEAEVPIGTRWEFS